MVIRHPRTVRLGDRSVKSGLRDSKVFWSWSSLKCLGPGPTGSVFGLETMKVTEVINIHLFNWPQRAAVGCVIGVDVHPSGHYTYPYPIMKLPIVMPQDSFFGDTFVTLESH